MAALRFNRWWFPLLCAIPYIFSLAWLLIRGQLWITQILLAPLLMGASIALLTWLLAYLEKGGRSGISYNKNTR